MCEEYYTTRKMNIRNCSVIKIGTFFDLLKLISFFGMSLKCPESTNLNFISRTIFVLKIEHICIFTVLNTVNYFEIHLLQMKIDFSFHLL